MLYALKRVGSPALRAFAFAYVYIILPKVVGTVVRLSRTKDYALILPRVVKSLKNALKGEKFPALAAQMSLGVSILEPISFLLLRSVIASTRKNLVVSTFVASFMTSLALFPRFQTTVAKHSRHLSLDLTLLVVTRAVDTVLATALSGVGGRDLSLIGDALLFGVSSALVMYAWFFNPSRLPPAYRKWITLAASMDDELVEMLRLVREKKLKYGEHGPHEHILDEYCRRYGQDPSRGSLVENQPLDCECIHAFKTKSCEKHALWRFVRGFQFAFKLYGGLNLIMLMIPRRHSNFVQRLVRSLRSSVRSSCFLATFIALNWYGVCLARTRVLPKLFPHVPATRWDDTVCVVSGCMLTGLSCFVDTPLRRKELALFVAPRAAGTLVNPEPTPGNLQLESVAFAMGMAVLVAFSRREASKVRGIFGRGLSMVFSLSH